MRLIFVSLLSLLASSPLLSLTEPQIRVEGATFRPFQLALPVFVGPLGFKMTEGALRAKIKQNLELSGDFHVINRKAYLTKVTHKDFQKKRLSMSPFKPLGVEGVVIGRIQDVKGQFEVEIQAHFVDILRGKFQKKYRVARNGLPFLSRKISSDIFTYFSNRRAPFMQEIIAMKKVKGKKQLVLMSFDGVESKQLTHDGTIKLLPSFSGFGTKILYTQFIDKVATLVERDLKKLRNHTRVISKRKGLNIGGVLSPDGKNIALTLSQDGNSNVYLLDKNGKKPQRLTSAWNIDTSPAFSPDGKKIAFVSARTGSPHIYVMNKDGSGQKRLTFQGRYNQSPSFSSSGDKIIFTGRDEHGNFDIFYYDLKYELIRRVTQNECKKAGQERKPCRNEDPSVSQEGDFIVFTSNRYGTRDLFITKLDGRIQKQLTRGADYWTPAFSK